jgi:hypothetical protein
MASAKAALGQFYTAAADYILAGFDRPDPSIPVIEPFAGAGDLLTWLSAEQRARQTTAYDIDPKCPEAQQRDTLADPPDYNGAFVLTNPPYLARNKSADKSYFDKYDTNDLYKCFLLSLTAADAAGGILILPAGFFLSPRPVDATVRGAFMSKYPILKVRYFEESVFADTNTTVVAFQFGPSVALKGRIGAASATPLTEQSVPWTRLPAGETRTFNMRAQDNWIIGGDVYHLSTEGAPAIGRAVGTLKAGMHLTGLTLTALDSGSADGRIKLEYKPGYVYPAKDTSRSYATLTASRPLTIAEHRRIEKEFNEFVEARRAETWSLFLPQYRESKEYARKRIPFELAYSIVQHLLRPVPHESAP